MPPTNTPPQHSTPRMPSRTRLVRPDHWRDEATGRLSPDARDAYLGLSTISDDEGWLLWRPATIAAGLYPYQSPARRERDLARRAEILGTAGLLELHDCGCAHLPRMKRDLAVRGGEKSTAIEEFHAEHLSDDGLLRSPTSRDSGSASFSEPASPSSSGSDSALPPIALVRTAEPTVGSAPTPMACDRCHEPIDDHGRYVKGAEPGRMDYVHRERCEEPEAVAS